MLARLKHTSGSGRSLRLPLKTPLENMFCNSVSHSSGLQSCQFRIQVYSLFQIQRPWRIENNIRCKANNRQSQSTKKNAATKKKKQRENVWSLENQAIDRDVEFQFEKKKRERAKKVKKLTGEESMKFSASAAIVTASMPVETEKVLQTQEPVIKPNWQTFVSSVSGIWRGVGAAFSPITAEMEPVSIGKRNEYLYDSYTLSKVEAVGGTSQGSEKRIHRTVNWVTANPFGEQGLGKLTIQDNQGQSMNDVSDSEFLDNSVIDGSASSKREYEKAGTPSNEIEAKPSSEVMEEELIGLEPGLVFFEDGSYSRGPLLLELNANGPNYFLYPTYQIEQCLVRGCHKRLRVVHTISVKDGGAEIELLRLAVYEEEWIGPSHIKFNSEAEESKLTPISQRKRISPPELVGSWKVFEIGATAILDEMENESQTEKRPSYVYLCMETLKKRQLPEVPAHFADEDAVDTQDITVLWLPAGITAYVDTKEDGVLTVGIGWYQDDGTNLVMERDYGSDGNLAEVRSKTEVKRRWLSDQL